MCGWCKLNAAALDTTVACGYNGIDQHNLGLLPPIAGIDTPEFLLIFRNLAIAPIAGIDTKISKAFLLSFTIAPPLWGLILHAASGQLLNGGAPSTLFHPPSTPSLCAPLATFFSGEAASAIRKRLQIRLADADRNGSIGIPDALLAARVAMGN